MILNIGTRVFGKTEDDQFELFEIIGNGAFGTVYKAHNLSSKEIFAVKTILLSAMPKHAVDAMVNEGNLLSSIKHENIVNVYYFHDGSKYTELPPYLILEFADGGTLETYLNQRRSEKHFISNTELSDFFIQLANGMNAINTTLVHRDIKPDNILFSNKMLKISDFGLSKVVGEITRTRTFKGINHIKYCAPEAWKSENNTIQMDMYSMGIVFYELATLTYPYNVKSSGDYVTEFYNAHISQIPLPPSKTNESLDHKLSQVIMKMISKRPSDRYEDWEQIIKSISESSSIEKKRNSDIEKLAKKAFDNYTLQEQERINKEEANRKKIEQEKIITYCFNELFSSVGEVVDEFNNASEFIKLRLIKNSNFNFAIYNEKNTQKSISVSIFPISDEKQILKSKTIKAWGYVKAPSGKGFNLFLTINSPLDIYGSWQIIYVSHSALVRNHDNRIAPFPFEINEIEKELDHINHNTMHIYNTDIDTFSPNQFIPFLEELL